MHCNLENTLFLQIIAIFFFPVTNIVMYNLLSLWVSWIVSWNGGIAESKGTCIFEVFDTHCQIAFRKVVLTEAPSSRAGNAQEPAHSRLSGDAAWAGNAQEPAHSRLSGDAAWVIHGGNSFSHLSLCFSFLSPFVSFLGFLPDSLLWKDRLINPVLINNLKLHSATVGV